MARPIRKGETVLVVGVRNEDSFGYHIAKVLHRRKATVAVGCEPSLVGQVTELMSEYGITDIFGFDASVTGDSERLAREVGEHYGRLDSIVHCAVWTNRKQLRHRIWDASTDNLEKTMQISVFSLNEMVKGAIQYLHRNSVVLAMTFPPGSERLMTGYGAMGMAKVALDKLIAQTNQDLGAEGKGISVGAGATAFVTGSSMVIPHIREYAKAVQENAPQGPLTMYETARVIAGIVLDGTARHSGGHVIPIDNGVFLLAAIALREGLSVKEFTSRVRSSSEYDGSQKEFLIAAYAKLAS